jgi:hypothetical protein
MYENEEHLMPRKTPKVEQTQCELRLPVEFMAGLYAEYGGDLRRVRAYQRLFYQSGIGQWAFFDDLDGEWMYLFTRHLRPELVVEIGCGSGWSSSWTLRALQDNAYGKLLSIDPRDDATRLLPKDLKERWEFWHGPVQNFTVPEVSFLLYDATHDNPECEQIMPGLLDKVQPGGIGCVHDVFMLPQAPAAAGHADAIVALGWLKAHDLPYFTPAKCYPESWAQIQEWRSAANLGANIHYNEMNPLLCFQR